MVRLNNLKNKKGNMGVIALVGVALVGGYVFMNGGMDMQPKAQDIATPSNGFYLDSLTGDSIYSISESGTGSDKEITIKVDKDDVTTAGLYNLTGSFKQNLKTGVALDSTSVVAYDVKVPFSSDLEMQDTSGEDLTVIDVSSSRIDGQKSKVQKTFTAADPVSIVAAIDWVQATAGLSTLEDIDESGEKTNLISLDFGQSNKVYLEIKN